MINNQSKSLLIRAELLSILISIVACLLIIVPIYRAFGNDYGFYIANIFAILIFINYTRLIFLLKYTPYAYSTIVKLVLIFASIPLGFYFVDRLYDFQRLLDEVGLNGFLNSEANAPTGMAKFARIQYLFFNSGTITVLIMLPIRMIVSIWRIRNNKNSV